MRTEIRVLFLSLFLTGVWGEILVNTPDGPVKGVAKATNSGKTYYAYYTIPYAKSPVGDRRFLESEPIDPWTEPHDGTTENLNICYQVYSDFPEENEDCLHMNVFTPEGPQTNASLPVMVNIHGGGFISGSGLESSKSVGGIHPTYLLEENVILVSFNYRLGVFGFLSTGDNVIPGNAGLSDQILALKWVQKNIAAFGGNPKRVTILGQSAGGASVGYMILSPRAKGLFAGAILESGTSLCPWAYQRNQTYISYKTGSFVDSTFTSTTDSKKLLVLMQNATAKSVDNASKNFANWDSSQPEAVERSQLQQGFYYAPVIDSAANNPVVPEYQYEALAKGNINKVPILLGICSEEGLMNLDQSLGNLLQAYDQNPAHLNPEDMHISSETVWNKVGNLIKEEYSPSSTFLHNTLGAIQYFTDQDFAKSLTKHAQLQSKYTDVYFYEFAYSGQMGGNFRRLPGSGNVTHTEEMAYIFSKTPISQYPASDQLVHKRLVKIWTNFATFQNPTPIAEELLQKLIWPKVTADQFQFVNIGNFSDTNLRVTQGKPKAKRLALWDEWYNNYGNRPFDAY